MATPCTWLRELLPLHRFPFFALATAWGGGAGNWLCTAARCDQPVATRSVCLVRGDRMYVSLWRLLPRWTRPVLPAMVTYSLQCDVYFAAMTHLRPLAFRRISQFLGQDQLNLFGTGTYFFLGCRRLGNVCVLAAIADWDFPRQKAVIGSPFSDRALSLAVLRHLLPAGKLSCWVVRRMDRLLVSRLTLVTAVFGLLVLASLRLPRWAPTAMFSVLCYFFSFFTRTPANSIDGGQRRTVVRSLAMGTRVVAVANPPDDWHSIHLSFD